MIVADTSLIASLALRNDRVGEAEAVLRRDGAWAAPVVWRSEMRQMLVKCMRREGMTAADGLRAMEVAEEMVAGREYQVLSGKVLEMAARSGCGGFECEYVALAQELGLTLVTWDEEVLKAFPRIAVNPAKFVLNH